jgi:hypothetical protein
MKSRTLTKTTLTLAAGAFLVATSASNAAVTLTQVGATTSWDINIDPITFTANSSVANVEWLIFEDYFSANATVSGTHVSGTLDVSVNGGIATGLTPFATTGTWGSAAFGPLDSNDLLINIFGVAPSLSGGDTVTVSGSLRFSSTVGLAPVAGPVNAAFWNSGDIIRTDEVSVATTVPEPGTTVLLGLAGLALIRRRRK